MPESGSGEGTGTDLIDIAGDVGTALIDWAVDGTPVGTIIDIIRTFIGDGDDTDTDSIIEYQKEQNYTLDNILDEIKSTNESVKALSMDVQAMNDSVQSMAATQTFFFMTTFTVIFCGYLGTRVKRLFRWRRMGKNEGLM